MSNEPVPDFTSPTETNAGGAESLGAWLAQTRAGYNAEQRDVARHLGLNPTIIQAIESDDFGRLGPPVFVRGYLSRYARLLNLPEQAVLERYQHQSGSNQDPPPLKVAHPLRRQTRVRDLRGLFYLLLVVGIGWTAIQNLNDLDPSRLLALWSGDDRGTSGKTASPAITATSQTQYPFQSGSGETTTTAATSPSLPLVGETPPSSRSNTALPAPDAKNLQPPSAPVSPVSPSEPATIPTTPSVITTVAGSTPEAGAVNAAAEAKLLLEFSNDCWVEVKDAQGNVLTNGLMKANSTRTLSGSAPFKVTLGNAPAARIILDDRLVDTEFYVPRRGTVSRFTLDRGQP
jgi:cytoskeleton protein RodZ